MFTPPIQRIKLHKVTVTRCTSQGCNFFYTFTGQHCWTAAGCWRHLSSNSHRNQFQLQLIFDSCRAPMPFGPKILTWIWQSLIWCHLGKMSFRVCLWSWAAVVNFNLAMDGQVARGQFSSWHLQRFISWESHVWWPDNPFIWSRAPVVNYSVSTNGNSLWNAPSWTFFSALSASVALEF